MIEPAAFNPLGALKATPVGSRCTIATISKELPCNEFFEIGLRLSCLEISAHDWERNYPLVR